MIKQLSRFIQEMKSVKRHQAKEEAKRLLDEVVRDRAGLLAQQGQDRYAFVHKTFQEYLTAMEIRDRQEEGFEVVLEHVEAHLHDPHWEEVLLLLIAQQKRGNPSRVLEAILNHDTPYEQWLHRNLFFAADCLAEDIEVKDKQLLQSLINQIIDLSIKREAVAGRKLIDRSSDAILKLEDTRYQNLLLGALKDRSGSFDPWVMMSFRAALGERQVVINELTQLINSDNYDTVFSATLTLWELEPSSELVFNRVLSSLEKREAVFDGNEANMLSQFETTSEENIEKLAYIASSADSYWSEEADLFLSNFWGRSDVVRQKIDLWLDGSDPKLNVKAASIIGMATGLVKVEGPSEITPRVQNILDNGDESMMFKLLRQMEGAEITSSAILERLHEALSHSNDDIKLCAAHCLATQGIDIAEVCEILLNYLTYKTGYPEKDKRLILDFEILNTIGKISNTNVAIRDAIIELAQKGKFKFRVVYSLLSLDDIPGELMAIIPALLVDPEESVRVWSLALLGKISQMSEATSNCASALLQDESERVRGMLAQVLSEWSEDRENSASALLKLAYDRETGVQNQAIRSLGKLGHCTEEITSLLLSSLNQVGLAASVQEALIQLGKISPEVLSTLIQWIEQNENEPYVGKGIDILSELVA